MKFALHFWGIFCCLCSYAPSKNIYARPDTVSIGALFTFNSTIGRVAKIAMAAAVSDINSDSSVLPGTNLVVQMRDSNCSGFVGIVQALQFMEKDTVAIIGPQSSVLAHVVSHVANELQVPMLSFAATDPTLTPLQFPFFVRTTHSDHFQMASVADLVNYYGWKQVTAIYIDDDYGRNGISSLGDELAKRRSKILYKAAVRPGAKKSEMASVLVRVAMMESRVLILHANPDSGLALLLLARNLGMTSSGYVWIATDWLGSFRDSSLHPDMDLVSAMQGILTLRQHTENTRRKSVLASKWSALVKRDDVDSRFLINSYGLYAYDTVWMIAHALDAFFSSGGNISFSTYPKLREITGGGLQLGAMTIFDEGRLLLERIRQVNFTGATGPVNFDSDGNLLRPAYDIVNIVGSGLRTIGYWSNYSGLSIASPETLYMKPANRIREKQNLRSVIWPGESTIKPRGWVFPNNGNELRIGIPNRVSYHQFVSVDNVSETVRGFCIDVFVAAINLLQYPVPYKFIPFGDGHENPSYTELINKILTNEYDAVVGDIAIVTNRTRVADFTQPYIESGLMVLTSVKKHSSSGWSFLQPFTIRMWCVTGLFFLIIGTVVWLLEHRINDDFRGPPVKQIITVFWFSFSTLFFAHREDTRSTLGRFVIIIWLFVVLIIQSSYTASLTSILTVQQLISPITGIDSLVASDGPIGFQAFPRDSPLAVDLSTAILELSENGDLQRIHEKWLNDRVSESQSQTNDMESDRLQVYSFSGLFLICGVACVATLAIHAGVLVHKYCVHATSSQQAGMSTDGSSRSSRSSLRAFLSFTDRREIDTRRASKEKAAALVGVGGDSIGGVSAASSTTSVSTTT